MERAAGGRGRADLAELVHAVLRAAASRLGRLEVVARSRRRAKVLVNGAGLATGWTERWLSVEVSVWAGCRRLTRGLTCPAGSAVQTAVPVAENLWREATAPEVSIEDAVYPLVCDGEFAGLLAHELVGHALEADIYQPGGPLTLGRRVAPGEVSVVDSPATADGYGGFGGYPVDDEGTVPAELSLVDGGVVSALAHSCSTAAARGERPTGHARALDWRHDPLPRLSATYFHPGTATRDQLLEQAGRGLWLYGARGGSGGRQAAMVARGARLVERGRLGRWVGSVLVTGDPAGILGRISGIGTGWMLYDGGEGGCGKGTQFPLPVQAGGPCVAIGECPVRHLGGAR